MKSDAVVPSFEVKSKSLMPLGMVLIIAGAAICAMAFGSDNGLKAFSHSYLWAYGFIWSVAIGCLFFVALHHITGAVWSVFLRRFAEMFASMIGVVAVLFVPIALFAIFHDKFDLYLWLDMSKEKDVHLQHILHEKEPYLNLTFFLIRAGVYFGIWFLFARFFVGNSIKQDAVVENKEIAQENVNVTVRMRNFSGPFMILFGFSLSFAAFDWFMSLDPYWFSTMFGVYIFAGTTLTALSVVTLTTVTLRAKGILTEEYVTRDHIYSLGALLFAFSCFWAYIAFSQFMLIWYANIPEETLWFYERMHGPWLAVSVALPIVRFVVPFFTLLSSYAKVNIKAITFICIVQLVGQWLDLYWLIMPQLKDAPGLTLTDFGPALLVTGVLCVLMRQFLNKNKAVAVGDPLFDKCKHFHL